MRILLVVHGIPLKKMGGVGLLVHHLCQELALQGHEVHVLSPASDRFKTQLTQQKKEWGTLHILQTQYLQWTDSWEHKQAKHILNSWLKRLQPDVCHVHHLSGLPLDFHTLLPPAARLIITLHDYAIPCARGQLYHREHRICTSNNPNNCLSCLQPFRASRGPIIRRLEQARMLLSSADVLLSPSLDLANRIQSFYPELSIQQVSLPLFTKTKDSSLKDTDFIFVGSIIPPKGLGLLLKALLRFPSQNSPSLKIIGFPASYPTWKNYQQYCQNLASLSPSITWLGEQEYASCIQEMKTARCLVLPSLWPENSPLTIREATALGLHVICSAWGGASELLSSSKFVLEKPSEYQLYQLLKKALEQPPASIQAWPEPRTYCKQLLSIYKPYH